MGDTSGASEDSYEGRLVQCLSIAMSGSDADTCAAMAEELEQQAVYDHHRVTLASAHSLLNSTTSALRVLHPCTSLDASLLKCQLYLAYDRPDLAAKALHKMKQVDEDSPSTTLAAALIALYNNDGQEAVYNVKTLSEQYGRSVKLLNLYTAAAAISGDLGRAKELIAECDEQEGAETEREDTRFNKRTIDAKEGRFTCGDEAFESAFGRAKVKYA